MENERLMLGNWDWEHNIDATTSNCSIDIVTESPEFIPVYKTTLSAGADLKACIPSDIQIEPGGQALINTGIKIKLPGLLCALVVPRSGLALKNGITVTNAPGLIDPDYRGTIGVILRNCGREIFTVHPQDRIAQLLIVPYFQASFNSVDKLDETGRGEGGFGHSGVKG